MEVIEKIEVKEEPIFCIEQYIKLIEDFFDTNVAERDEDFVLFRGQDCISTPKPRLGRIVLRDESREEAEKNMMEKFKIESVPFLDPIPKAPLDWLSVAQHHRLPTRLLDWTRNALAALWFAIQEAQIEKDPSKESDYRFGTVWVLLSEQKSWIKGDEHEDFGPYKVSEVHFFRPRHFARRISAQSGYFSLHPMRKDEFDSLSDSESGIKQLKRIEIPRDAFCHLRDQLDHYNVNYSTLFPDLDGIAKNIEWLHSRFEDEQGCDKDNHHCIKDVKKELVLTINK